MLGTPLGTGLCGAQQGHTHFLEFTFWWDEVDRESGKQANPVASDCSVRRRNPVSRTEGEAVPGAG